MVPSLLFFLVAALVHQLLLR